MNTKQPTQAGLPASADRVALTVIIPTYNSAGSLQKCLDALLASNFRNYELVIVDDHSTDGSEQIASQGSAKFIRHETNQGAGAARNHGAGLASADILFFLDSDVLVEPDTLDKVMNVLAKEPELSALFCSYQDDTLPKNFASQYKNLLHHHTHQVSGREAASFCGGYGAIRSEIFRQIGGFDERYRAMEDVELGYRLHKAGHRIALCRDIQLTHTKRYTLASLIRADVLQRAIPWTKIMLQQRIFRSDLNLRPNNLASAALVLLMMLTPFLPLPIPWLVSEVLWLLVFVLLNRDFLSFLKSRRGIWFAVRAVPMMFLQHVYSGLGLLLGVMGFIKDLVLNRTSQERTL